MCASRPFCSTFRALPGFCGPHWDSHSPHHVLFPFPETGSLSVALAVLADYVDNIWSSEICLPLLLECPTTPGSGFFLASMLAWSSLHCLASLSGISPASAPPLRC